MTDKQPQLRIEKVHGGQNVENISTDQLTPVNDAACQHEKLIRDPSETDFTAFTCSNDKCGEVFIFAKS